MGGFGRHIMKDITWSSFVNTKGQQSAPGCTQCIPYFHTSSPKTSSAGLPHSNLHADLHMEHENAMVKENIRAARGVVESWKWNSWYRNTGNLTANVVARASRLAPLRRKLEGQLYPKYTERWIVVGRQTLTSSFKWWGHRPAGVQGARRWRLEETSRGGPEGHAGSLLLWSLV